MEMVCHADKHIKPDVVLLYPFGKPIKKSLAVCVVFLKVRLLSSPVTYHPTGNLVNRSSELNS